MATITQRIDTERERLSPGERRVARVVLADPEAVAFGTVASVAERAGTSGPTVLRLAAKLGFEGFVRLQAAVQEELAARLRPAAEQIRRPVGDPLARAIAVEIENVHATLAAVDPSDFEGAVERLADTGHRVGIVSGELSFGVAWTLGDGLGMLRDGVELWVGSEVRVTRRLAMSAPQDVLVAIDLRRYDRWVLDTARRAAGRGAHLIALTDSRLSPLASAAHTTFVVDAQGAGPFDSHVGTLALVNALVAGVADRLRPTATRRLDRIESAWTDAGALVEP